MTSQSDFGGPDHRRPLVAKLLSAGRDPSDSRLFVVYTPPKERPGHQTATIETESTLCDKCRDVLEYMAYYLGTQQLRDTETAKEDLYSAARLHEDLASMALSANELECHICVNLARQFESILVPECIGKKLPNVPIEVSWTQNEWDEGGGWRLEFALTNPDMQRDTENYLTFFRMRLWPAEKAAGLFARPTGGSPAPTGRDVFVMQESNGSLGSRELALQWFYECEADRDGRHAECNRGIGEYLPKRVLDVEFALKENRLRLVTVEHRSDLDAKDRRYATLSHCWGQWGISGLPSLNKGNAKERFETGLGWEDIPPTFQHALFVADWFQVKWLWIDSLCIIQDDDADWQHEASQMAKVYKHAVFNIAADAAKDARGGLFRPRRDAEVTPIKLCFPALSETYLAVREEYDSLTWLQEGQLSSRAWVFQERQLARRVLHFTRNELFWECCVRGPAIASEIFPRGVPLRRHPKAQTWQPHGFDHYSKFQALLAPNGCSPQDVYDIWEKLCRMYSSKRVTFVTDKLVSLSGLAKEIGALLPGDRYVAGHWHSTLPASLVWRTEQNKQERPRPGAVAQTAYVAPSWSWASSSHLVSFEPPDKRDILASVIDVDVLTVGDDATGALASASLTIRGFLRPVTIHPDWKPSSIIYHEWHRMTIDDGVEIISEQPLQDGGFYFRLDEGGCPSRIDAFFLFIGYGGRLPAPAGEDTRGGTLTLVGLLLERTLENSNRYRKIGTLDIYGGNTVDMRYKMSGSLMGQDNGVKLWQRLREAVEPGRSGEPTDEESPRDFEGKIDHEARTAEREAAVRSEDLEVRLYAGDGEYDRDVFSRLAPQEIVLV